MGTVGKNIRALREAAGHAHQGNFAALAGVAQTWLSDVENDRYDMPDTESLMRIAAAIPCSIDALVRGTPQLSAIRREVEKRGGGGEPMPNVEPEVIALAEFVSMPQAKRLLDAIRPLPDDSLHPLADVAELVARLYERASRRTGPDSEASVERPPEGIRRRVTGRRQRS